MNVDNDPVDSKPDLDALHSQQIALEAARLRQSGLMTLGRGINHKAVNATQDVCESTKLPIEWETEIPPNKIADCSAVIGLLDFTRLIVSEVAQIGLASRLHTIEAEDDKLNNQNSDRIYLRDSKVGGNRCYLFVTLEYGADQAWVGFGELQHSGGEPTWGDRHYDQTPENAKVIAAKIRDILN